MRLNKEQKEFLKGCVSGYLDSKKQEPHTAKEMADWASIAWRKTKNEKICFSSSAVVGVINELRDESYLISRDPSNRGYRCLVGKRNATPDILGITESIKHEKARVATSIHNNIVRPGMTIQQTVISNVQLGDALRLIGELRRSDKVLDEAVGQLKELSGTEYEIRAVPVQKKLTA